MFAEDESSAVDRDQEKGSIDKCKSGSISLSTVLRMKHLLLHYSILGGED